MIRFTNFAMKHVAAIMILIVLLLGSGVYATSQLKLESFPDISFPVVLVTTTYQAPPKDIVEDITKPVEKALANVAGLDSMSSTSSDNVSSVILQFVQGTNVEDKKKDIESLIANIKLPVGAERPKAQTFGFASFPSYFMAISSEGMNQTALDQLFKDVLEPGFTSIAGTDHVDSIGSREAKLDIKLDANALQAYNLTSAQVIAAIRAALTEGPAGTVKTNGNTELIRISGDMNSIFSMDNLEIMAPTGDTLLLKQIAKVEAVADSEYIARVDGLPAIGVNLYKTKDANAVQFSDDIQKLIKTWQQQYPGLKFQKTFDMADSVRESVNGLLREGILGAVLASLMILVFLRNFRMTLIVLVSIPLSILITLLMMWYFDISLNIMTLGGMAIAVGRVVDDSIVVIENIFSQLQKAQEREESVIRLATKQVASAITSSTLTTVGVFGPIGLVGGIAGQIFRPFAVTIGCALLASLLVALTVIPLLTKLLVLRSSRIKYHEEPQGGRLTNFYQRSLTWSLNHRKSTLLVAFLLFVISLVAIVPNLAITFIPSGDEEKAFYYEIKLPKETSLETTDAKLKELEKVLQEAKDADGNPVFVYTEALAGYTMQGDKLSYMGMLMTEVASDKHVAEVKKEYQDKLSYNIPKGGKVTPQSLGGGGPGESDSDFTYSLKGDDFLLLEQAAELVQTKLAVYPELSNVKNSLSDAKMQINIKVDQSKARLYGLSAAQIRDSVRSWVSEEQLGELKFDNVSYTTVVSIDESFRNSLESIGGIQLKTASGSTIELRDVADVVREEAPTTIHRDKQEQVVSVTAKINSNNKAGISAKVSKDLSQLELPSGVTRQVGGISEDIFKSFSQLFIAMAVSIFIVYFVMVLAFGNASAPFAILFSLPLAAIGGLFGLLVSRQPLDVTALIGFMMLIGIVVTNAIVLIDRVQQLREEGYTTRHSLVEAGLTRLRPIIMTAVATIVALVPLALGLSKGTIISQGLAVVVIGGLTTSTVLTLVVVPVVYEIIDTRKTKRAERKARKRRGPAAGAGAAGVTVTVE